MTDQQTQDRIESGLGHLAAALTMSYDLAVEVGDAITDDLNARQRADYNAARNEIDAALRRIERLVAETEQP
jgi:hypothetical protein